jgi:hypothetical protein
MKIRGKEDSETTPPLQPETRNLEPETSLFLFNLPRDFAALKTRPSATFNLPTFQPSNLSTFQLFPPLLLRRGPGEGHAIAVILAPHVPALGG